MPFDVARAFAERSGENFALHERYMNQQLARTLRTLGFDRNYIRGEGCYLYDDTGAQYLDFLSGFGVYALGRSHPAVKASLHQALDLDLPNMVQMDCALLPGLLAEQLASRAHQGISRVFFCNSGAESVEAAIKFARHSTQRPKILYAEHAFHGLTTGALALNGGKEFRKGFGDLLESAAVPFGNLEALEQQLRGKDVAAFIVEPIQGKGVYCAPAEYWRAAQQLCRQYGTLLVTDEVQTGVGRTGKFFCHEHWGLEPDIITISKALSGGFVPIGAMLTTEKIFASVYDSMEDALKHSTTFGRNQMAMVAGLATLATFDDEDIVGRAERTGADLQGKLRGLAEQYELIHDIRGLGLMIGIEFGEPRSDGSRPAVPQAPDHHSGGRRQRQHHQASPAAHRRARGSRLLRAGARRCHGRRPSRFRAHLRVRSDDGTGRSEAQITAQRGELKAARAADSDHRPRRFPGWPASSDEGRGPGGRSRRPSVPRSPAR